jgi:lipoate-protein ligase A
MMKWNRMRFAWMETSTGDPSEQLRIDERLLEEGRAIFRIWESHRECVVIGYSSRPDRDVNLDACERSATPVLRRCSGGGAVVLGPGCLNYSLVLPLAWEPRWHDVRYSFNWSMDRMRNALSLPQLKREGDSDLAIERRKVSGNAQRRTQHAILHHGTLLYGFDAASAERFLKLPQRQPDYRAGRSHRDFLGNLPLSAEEIRRRLVAAWCPRAGSDDTGRN